MTSKTQVNPVHPPAPWVGGKRLLSKRLATMIDATPHSLYAEPFVGMGGVFFKRSEKPKAEVINDRSGDVVNLFRILQRHYPQFMETIRFQITSRREFERLANTSPETLTDLERAARFLYLQRTAFGGKVTHQNFGMSKERGSRFNLTTLVPLLEDIHDRLAGVVLENMDWHEFVERYDSKRALFYLDPPYWGNEKDYGADLFDRSQFEKMADLLSRLRGKFILSINDRPEVRSVFSGFELNAVELNYSLTAGRSTRAKELIICPRS